MTKNELQILVLTKKKKIDFILYITKPSLLKKNSRHRIDTDLESQIQAQENPSLTRF